MGSSDPDPNGIVDREEFAAALVRMKRSSGLSFRALARRTETSGVPLLPFTTFRDYVQGRSLPSPERLDAILTALGAPADEGTRAAWRTALDRVVAARARPPSDLRPYPGAGPVTTGLRGRDGEVAEILARVAEAPAGGVVVVTGSSGVGVSSVLRAGVAPRLDGVVVLDPAPAPAPVLAALLTGDDAVVLVDDLPQDAELDALLRVLLAGEPDGGPRVLLGLREDRLVELTAPGARPATTVRVAGLSAAGLRAVMAEPATAAGFPLAEGLAEVVLGELDIAPDAQTSPPGAVALVVEAMSATWSCAVAEGSTRVSIAHYREAGGVRGAAERLAERAYAILPPERRPLVRPLLLRMVRGRGTQAEAESARRRVPRSTVAHGRTAQAAAAAEAVVEALAKGRVVTVEDGAVELAHDVVLRGWPRLAGWVDADQPVRAMLTEAAWVWHDAGRDPGALLAGRRLAAAVGFAETTEGRAELDPLEQELVAASRAEERRGRQTRELRIAVVVLAVALVVVLGILVGLLVGL